MISLFYNIRRINVCLQHDSHDVYMQIHGATSRIIFNIEDISLHLKFIQPFSRMVDKPIVFRFAYHLLPVDAVVPR